MSDTVKDTVAELKNIPTETELREQLYSSVLVVTFKKMDGDERIMTCTTQLSFLPEDTNMKVTEPTLNLINVWDINAKGWRSFKYDRITNVTEVK
jgi:hypothetical protein